MSKKSKNFHKKKGSVVKDLSAKILKTLNKNSQQSFNYKQIASKVDISDANGKQQLITKLEELKQNKRILFVFLLFFLDSTVVMAPSSSPLICSSAESSGSSGSLFSSGGIEEHWIFH